MDWIRQWWVQPDHFRWLSGYLGHRKLQSFTRRMMALITAALGTVPVLMLFSPAGPETTFTRILAVLVAVCCATMAVLWLVRWPNRRQSIQFAVVSNLCIAVSCLTELDVQTGLVGCTTFAALAGYVAFFHSSLYLSMVLGTAAATSVICASQVAESGDWVLAVSRLIIIWIAVLAVPFSAQVLVHLLGDDALKSDTDPLTGLRNRRGFYRSARELVGNPYSEQSSFFSIIMVDLDRFKQINDTNGHATGDRILVAVADRLRRSAKADAVVARVGGEEFLIAQRTPIDTAWETGERLREDIATIPLGVTASVGVTSIMSHAVDDDAVRSTLNHLVEAADAAMYAAKRAGGNQTCDHATIRVRRMPGREPRRASSGLPGRGARPPRAETRPE